ncbi:hypothetical protein ACFY00_33105 [Kitasatospora sp. NPDC001540]|uniref:hypothetical protein n=1 Tax=Kitasatospora sp. NPDC001540 TaxID=3364014 RepID=UPI00369571B3
MTAGARPGFAQPPLSPSALADVLKAAEALAAAIAAAPFPLRAVVGPEARACLQVPSGTGDDVDRMLRVEQAAALMPAEPQLVEDCAGFYWQAEVQRASAVLQVWTRLGPVADQAQP